MAAIMFSNVKCDGNNDIKKEKFTKEERPFFDDQFSFLFYKITGNDERIDPFELQRIMDMIFRAQSHKGTDFSLEACRAMVATFDHSRVGKLNFSQFKMLWKKLTKWKHIFDTCDVTHDGTINGEELDTGLRKLGLQLNEDSLRSLMNRFQNNDNVIEFDDFIQICCKASTARGSFEDIIKDGNASLDIFLLEIMYPQLRH